MRALGDFPWDQLTPYADEARRHPDGIVDLSVGSPVDATPEIFREALAEAADAPAYPPVTGTPELVESVVDWSARTRGVTGLAAKNVLPVVGSKEFVATLALFLGLGPDDAVVHPTVAYPTYSVGAAVAGAQAVPADDPDQWPENTRLVWLNTPANPTGRTLDLDELRRVRARARELGAIVASDECYAALGWSGPWSDEPVPSILDDRITGGDRRNLISVCSLSKQSNLAGYRAAFVTGCASVIARVTEPRRHAGLMMPAPVQHALAVGLADDAHVATQRERYRARRDALSAALTSAGFTINHSEAGLYLWATRGEDAFATVAWFAERGILVAPGTFYGEAGARHVRVALTATDERVRAAAERVGAPS